MFVCHVCTFRPITLAGGDVSSLSELIETTLLSTRKLDTSELAQVGFLAKDDWAELSDSNGYVQWKSEFDRLCNSDIGRKG